MHLIILFIQSISANLAVSHSSTLLTEQASHPGGTKPHTPESLAVCLDHCKRLRRSIRAFWKVTSTVVLKKKQQLFYSICLFLFIMLFSQTTPPFWQCLKAFNLSSSPLSLAKDVAYVGGLCQTLPICVFWMLKWYCGWEHVLQTTEAETYINKCGRMYLKLFVLESYAVTSASRAFCLNP